MIRTTAVDNLVYHYSCWIYSSIYIISGWMRMTSNIFKALVRLAYDTLGLQTYFTSGPTETKAWTILKGFTAPQVDRILYFIL